MTMKKNFTISGNSCQKLLLERLESKNVKHWDVEELRNELMRRKKRN